MVGTVSVSLFAMVGRINGWEMCTKAFLRKKVEHEGRHSKSGDLARRSHPQLSPHWPPVNAALLVNTPKTPSHDGALT